MQSDRNGVWSARGGVHKGKTWKRAFEILGAGEPTGVWMPWINTIWGHRTDDLSSRIGYLGRDHWRGERLHSVVLRLMLLKLSITFRVNRVRFAQADLVANHYHI